MPPDPEPEEEEPERPDLGRGPLRDVWAHRRDVEPDWEARRLLLAWLSQRDPE